jgi:hypothetical protein
MISVEIGCLSHRHYISLPSPMTKEWGQTLIIFFKEVKLRFAMNNEVYWNQTTQYNNARVKNRRFKVGDRVLRKLEAMNNIERRRKSTLKWDGQFRVMRVIKSNTYHLQDKKGKSFPHTWHFDHLKIYFNWILQCCL